MIDTKKLELILEGALLAAGKPLSLKQLADIFDDLEKPDNETLRAVLEDIGNNCKGRGYELKQVSSGYRFQVREEVAPWVGKLFSERPQKYSRALLETLALIAYRQPITRGDIEDIRGVAVNSNIIKTLMERDWIRIVGHKDVPGRPAMFATTRSFLDYFNLKNLDELPTLADIKDLDSLNEELNLAEALGEAPAAEGAAVSAAEEEAAAGEIAKGQAAEGQEEIQPEADTAPEAADTHDDTADADEIPETNGEDDAVVDVKHSDTAPETNPDLAEGESVDSADEDRLQAS